MSKTYRQKVFGEWDIPPVSVAAFNKLYNQHSNKINVAVKYNFGILPQSDMVSIDKS